MNTYYVRVKSLLPTLSTQPHSVAYTQRFLFLLSEFLRVNPGWRQQPPHPILLEDFVHDDVDGAPPSSSSSSSSSSATPNLLAKGPGILENTYELVEEVMRSSKPSTREKVAVIALRGMASLCMLSPTTYFYRCESHIRDALTSSDVSHQVQGLTLLVDFLKEEDATVEAASQRMDRLNTTALIAGGGSRGSASEEEEEEEENKAGEAVVKRAVQSHPRGYAKRRGTASKASASKKRQRGSESATVTLSQPHKARWTGAGDATEDYNSGMATWVLQRFHTHIVQLGGSSPHVQVRSLCLQLLQMSTQCGLLPPDRYVHVIIALAADVNAPLRRRALEALTAHCDGHSEVVASCAGRAILLAYDLHHACGADLLHSAVCASGEAGCPDLGGVSLHGHLFRLLHKRLRENFTLRMPMEPARGAAHKCCRQFLSATTALRVASSPHLRAGARGTHSDAPDCCDDVGCPIPSFSVGADGGGG